MRNKKEEKRIMKVTLLLTETEKKTIQERAEEIKLDVNNYIRYKIFN